MEQKYNDLLDGVWHTSQIIPKVLADILIKSINADIVNNAYSRGIDRKETVEGLFNHHEQIRGT